MLITGGGGQLGVALAEAFPDAVAVTRDEWDITLPAPPHIAEREHDLVLHTAGWTDVDGAEDDPQGAAAVNVGGTANVVSLGAPVVYISTDYVFDGTSGPYGESDDPEPINAYGRTKLAGERATALVNGRSFIVRTSWLFGPHGGNFVETMLRLGEGGGPVVVVHDQVGNPTYTGHLAVGLLRLVDSAAYGIHHMTGEGSCSWYEFAMEIFRQAEVVTRVMASTSDMMERPAKRPADSVLVSRRSAPIKLPPWQRGLSDYLTRRDREEETAPKRRSSASKRQPVLDHWPERVREEVAFEGNADGEFGDSPDRDDDHGQDAA
jgi:dTDP-4-dehydrorhamnose reductase